MIEFCNDDEGYLAWIGMNPTGSHTQSRLRGPPSGELPQHL
jgi:hypothetical protein